MLHSGKSSIINSLKLFKLFFYNYDSSSSYLKDIFENLICISKFFLLPLVLVSEAIEDFLEKVL